MAVTLSRMKISVNLSAVVSGAIESVRAIRAIEQSRKEAEFQKAVAGGMSYSAQVAFREKQLEEEKSSSFNDASYISTLEVSVAETKKLARYETIRNKYKSSLDDYVGGKESISQHISILQDLLSTEQDPALQDEIRTKLSEANKEQASIELNAIKNRALVAQQDKSTSLLDKSIKEVESKRAVASINENDDEVAMWDSTLIALRSSKSKLQIENGLNEITYQTNKKNLQSNDKLALLNGYISSADASNEVVYGGVTYPSLKAYWENKRGEYLSNNYFDDIKKEMDAQTATIAATNRYGQVPASRIDAVNNFYKNLASRPEFAPYVTKIEQQRVENVNSLVTDLADSIYNEAASTGEQGKAQTAILSMENKFGVKVSREPFATETGSIAGTTTKDVSALGKPASNIVAPPAQPIIPVSQTDTSSYTPEQKKAFNDAAALIPETPKPAAPVVPTPAPTTIPEPLTKTVVPVASAQSYVVKAGDTLSGIAKKLFGDATRYKELATSNGITDPNKIQTGATLKYTL